MCAILYHAHNSNNYMNKWLHSRYDSTECHTEAIGLLQGQLQDG